ncbi:MAG TPA: 2Fe-2S iron-sulfur cluster-binding protein [Steroidobacteraceae bacterium]|nr:2Fe-2S iron-sulfur cluster-binding protein [Steroidobacteraceae bacterium]
MAFQGNSVIDQRHTVLLKPHERRISASAERSVLDAALDSGLNLPHSCKSGHCSSCSARLLAGEIAYPHGLPVGITEQEAAAGFVLLCQARPRSDLTLEVRLVASAATAEIKTLPCRIARMRRLAPDVMQVLLRLPSVESLAFQPGQYLDVLLEDGRRRSFSIASPPHDSELLELHVRHAPGGRFTDRLFGTLEQGALLKIEGPLGQLCFRDGARPALLVAGGTGFAPLKSMLRHALEKGTPRELHCYWGARRQVDLYEEELLLEWVQRYPQLHFGAVLSEAASVAKPHQRLGWVHEAVLADHASLDAYELYAAGPPPMIDAIRASFPARGLDPERLHFDSFDYAR